MNKQFTRMQKLAGIITEGHTVRPDGTIKVHPGDKKPVKTKEGYQGTDYESSEDTALDMIKTEAGLPGGVPEGRMTKSQFKEKIREAILAEKSLSEAKKKKKEEESEDVEDTTDVDVSADVDNLDVSNMGGDESKVDMNMDTTTDVDAGSSEAKKAFSELTDAYRAAKELGDEKLIRQIANTITYFNKNIILDQG